MKKISFSFSCMLVAVILGMVSCKKDNDAKATAEGSLTTSLIFDGGAPVNFKSSNTVIAKQGSAVSISAKNDSGNETITFTLIGVTAAGTYKLQTPVIATILKDYTQVSDLSVSFSTGISGNDGEIVITKFTDTEAEGTFTITSAKNSAGKVATAQSGKFSGKVSKQ